MEHSGNTGDGSLTDEQGQFLRACAERPDEISPYDIFDLLEGEAEIDGTNLGTVTTDDGNTVGLDGRVFGARALNQYATEVPAGLTEYSDLLVTYLDDENEDVRKSVIRTIYNLVSGGHDAFREPPVDPLIDRLGKEDQKTSKVVARILVALLAEDDPAVPRAVDTTVDLFGGDKFEAGSGIQALVVLGRAFPKPVMGRLGDRLADDDPTVRKYAVRTFAALARDYPDFVVESVPTLLDLLDDDDEYTREHTLETLVEAARTDPVALDGAVYRLVEYVDADHNKVRRSAVRILVELARADVDVSQAITALQNRLDDEDKIARRDAVYALGILRTDEALEEIRALTDGRDLELQAVAASAVERITEGESDPPMTEFAPGELFVARNQQG